MRRDTRRGWDWFHGSRSFALAATTLSAIVIAGCGMEAPYPASGPAEQDVQVLAAQVRSTSAADLAALQDVELLENATEPGAAVRQRRIIYEARLSLIVEQFDGVPQRIAALAAEHGGYVSRADVHGAAGSPRSGEWTVRVEAARYAPFLEEASRLGELESRHEDSQEVTEEFYDLEARIRSKQQEEARLLVHLDQTTSKLEDILTVEKELLRVREELERLQGRVRLLTDRSEMSTVSLTVREVQGYVPAESPTFATRLGRTWDETLTGLLTAGQGIVLFGVAAVPWLLILAVPALLAWRVLRRMTRRRPAAQPT